MLIIIYDAECLACLVEREIAMYRVWVEFCFFLKVLICVHVLGFWRFVLERKLSCGDH